MKAIYACIPYGDKVDFLITIKNDGDADMEKYVLVDDPQTGLEYVSDDSHGVKNDKGQVQWLINLKTGDEVKIKVTCKVVARRASKLYNKALLYQPDGKALVAIGEAEVIAVAGIAEDIIQAGITHRHMLPVLSVVLIALGLYLMTNEKLSRH
jgi:uncharacterized repeat protein (TIGR01451 family)